MQRIRSFAFSFGRVRDRRQFAILRRECASERSERSAVESREFTLKRCVGGEADYTYSSRNSVVIPYKFSSFENPHNGEKQSSLRNCRTGASKLSEAGRVPLYLPRSARDREAAPLRETKKTAEGGLIKDNGV